jgi:hypothetical protein
MMYAQLTLARLKLSFAFTYNSEIRSTAYFDVDFPEIHMEAFELTEQIKLRSKLHRYKSQRFSVGLRQTLKAAISPETANVRGVIQSQHLID